MDHSIISHYLENKYSEEFGTKWEKPSYREWLEKRLFEFLTLQQEEI